VNVLLELAARCEALGEPDRDLFRDAFDVCFPRPKAMRKTGFEHIGDGLGPYTNEYRAYGDMQGQFNAFLSCQAWIDAAMMLVPAKYGQYEVYAPDYNTLGWTVHLAWDRNLHLESQSGFAASYALALCAAALRARAAIA